MNIFVARLFMARNPLQKYQSPQGWLEPLQLAASFHSPDGKLNTISVQGVWK
jgi:hypothetical protein